MSTRPTHTRTNHCELHRSSPSLQDRDHAGQPASGMTSTTTSDRHDHTASCAANGAHVMCRSGASSLGRCPRSRVRARGDPPKEQRERHICRSASLGSGNLVRVRARRRERLLNLARPFLERDETVRGLFLAASRGPWDWTPDDGWSDHLVIVTDKRVTVLCTDGTVELVARVPTYQPVGRLRGLWTRIDVGDRKYWVGRRSFSDIRVALGDGDNGLRSGA